MGDFNTPMPCNFCPISPNLVLILSFVGGFVVVNALVSINDVALQRARLLHGWVTVTLTSHFCPISPNLALISGFVRGFLYVPGSYSLQSSRGWSLGAVAAVSTAVGGSVYLQQYNDNRCSALFYLFPCRILIQYRRSERWRDGTAQKSRGTGWYKVQPTN